MPLQKSPRRLMDDGPRSDSVIYRGNRTSLG